MNLVEIVLTTEYTSVPAHCKIYCCEELIFENVIEKDTVIKHEFNSIKTFNLKIIKSGRTYDVAKKHKQIINIKEIKVNNINLKVDAFGTFNIKNNFFVNDQTLQTSQLFFNGEWSIDLLEQKTLGTVNVNNFKVQDVKISPHTGTIRDNLSDCDIVCFGCSQTYGAYLEPNETWPYQLSKITNLKVNNLGNPVSNINEITAFVEHYVKNYKAKIILILFPHSFRRQIEINGNIENILPYHEANRELMFHGEEHSIINLSFFLPTWLKKIHKNIFVSTYQLDEYNLMSKTPIKDYLLPYFDDKGYPKASDNLHFSPEYNKDYAELLANFMKEKGLI